MFLAKQSTAKTLVIGPVLDSAGAEYASAVIGDLSISKNGGTLTALASAATLTLIANGQYTLVLTTGNLDTLGTAEISCNKSTYQMRQKEIQVVPSTVYDALITNAVNATGGLVGATGTVTTLAGVIATATNITAATGVVLSGVTHTGAVIPTVTTVNGLAAGVITAASIAANAIDAATFAADVDAEARTWLGLATANLDVQLAGISTTTEIADAVWDEATSGHTTSGTYGGRIVRATNSNVEVQLTGSYHMSADVHAFQADVIDSAALAISAVTEIQSGLATPTNITAATGVTVSSIGANVVNASALAADAVAEIQSGLATAANLLIVSDGVGYITSVLLGTISDAGTAGETYVITFGGATYTLDYTGLDATGNRTGVTRTKV